MHVGIVTNAPFPDENMFAREQAAALIALGHEVTIFARPSSDPSWPLPDGVSVASHHWETDPGEFVRALERAAPDILHVQQRRGCGWVLRLGCPAVVEITSTSLRPFPLRHLALALTMWELRGDHPIGTANRALVGRLRPADFYAPNGYSSWALEVAQARAREGWDPERGLTVYQGSFSPLRRLDRLLEAFQIVSAERPDARLLLIGGRVEEDHEPLLDCAERLGVMEQVAFSGRTGADSLVESMTAATMSVSWIPPTRGFQHQPPLKILDAQAAGVPILATPTAASQELLAVGGGRLADAAVEPFAQAWIGMLGDLRTGTEFDMADRDRFLRQRSWKNIVENIWLALYEQRVSRPQS